MEIDLQGGVARSLKDRQASNRLGLDGVSLISAIHRNGWTPNTVHG